MTPSATELRNRACAAMGVRLDQLQGDSRHPKVVMARAVVCHLLRDVELLSFAKIGKMVRPDAKKGGHSCVIWSYRLGKGNKDVQEWVEKITQQGPSNAQKTRSDN